MYINEYIYILKKNTIYTYIYIYTYLLPSVNIHICHPLGLATRSRAKFDARRCAIWTAKAHLRVIRKKRMDAKHGWRKDIYHVHFVNYISYIDTYGICYVFFALFFPINYSCKIRPWSGQDHWLTMHWPIVGSVRTCRECMSRHKERSWPITKSGSYVFSQIFS